MGIKTVKELFSNVTDFEELLETASSCAQSTWELNFVEDIAEKFEAYGRHMIISDAQIAKLEKIGGV